jgi:hypothetical protein
MYNPTPEQARKELRRRFRDEVTGEKLRGKKLRQTDGRMSTSPATPLPTAELVEIANWTPPTQAHTSTPVHTTCEDSTWVTDRMSHPLYAGV